MTAVEPRTYRLGEFHSFQAAGRQFLYLVPSGGIFELDEAAIAVMDRLGQGEVSHEVLQSDLLRRGLPKLEAAEVIDDLHQCRALLSGGSLPEFPSHPPPHFPLQTLVLNLTNQCNLSCQYCYEYGEDKVATPEGKPKFMDFETAKAAVDFLLEQSAGRTRVHITFFGGETLMNFPLLKRVVSYATETAAKRECSIDFSLTTNATLLTPPIIEFLAADHRIPL